MIKILNILDIKPNMYSINENGIVKNIRRNKILSRQLSVNGYFTVHLQTTTNERHSYYIHQLVAYAFLSKPNSKAIVNHKDLNKQNNNVDNLEWTTYSINNKWENRNTNPPIIKTRGLWSKGETTCGENNGMHIYSNETIELICKALEKGLNYTDTLKYAKLPITNNNRYLVSHINRGSRWKCISKKYKLAYNR